MSPGRHQKILMAHSYALVTLADWLLWWCATLLQMCHKAHFGSRVTYQLVGRSKPSHVLWHSSRPQPEQERALGEGRPGKEGTG